MRTRLLAWYRMIKGSYWFVPGLFALLAILLAFGSLQLDRLFGDELSSLFDGLGSSSPEGARAILTTIGGSMLSVGGIVFSITIAAVVFASAQYGPHIIPEFMRDRSNQVTLGVFIATFIYCLLALYRVQAGESVFVPHLTIILALFFAAASLITFIYFIHHILETLHVSNVIARLGGDLIVGVKDRFPAEHGRGEAAGQGGDLALPAGFLEEAVPVLADGTGYIHTLSADPIFDLAAEKGLIVRLVRRPGDFVAADRPLAWVWPPEQAESTSLAFIRRCYAWGAQKTQDQDIGFLIDQLTGITARAMSPGINDPYTAVDTIHWMGAALSAAGRGHSPASIRRDGEGRIRLIAHPLSFEELTGMIFSRVRPYIAADRNAALATLTVMSDVAFDLEDAAHRGCILTEARRLGAACEEVMPNLEDRKAVAGRLDDLTAAMRNKIGRFAAGERYGWLEGRA